MNPSSPPPTGVALAPGSDPVAAPGPARLLVVDAVGAQLRQRGWTAHLEVLDVCGEIDVRLRVTCAGVPVHVELLGPRPAPSRDSTWCAVRITPGDRAVWRGPHLGCSPDELVRFLEALGAQDVAADAGPYQLLS